MKNIIFNSLKEAFILIWKNRALFILLFAIQIAFLFVLSSVSLIYMTKMVESARAITDYLSQQKLDEASIASSMMQQKSLLGDDPLSISKNFNEVLKNFRLVLVYTFTSFILFGSLLWAITHHIVRKTDLKSLMKIFFKTFVVLLFYLGLIFLFFLSLLSISIAQAASEGEKLFVKYWVFFVLSAVLAYFMFVSLSLASKTELKNIIQKTLAIGIKKIHYVFAVYFVNIILFVASIFLLQYSIEKSLFILMLSLIIMIFSIVFGRIFVVSVVKKLQL